MKYRVLSGANANSLEKQVIDLSKDGYVPQGGIHIASLSDGSILFSQAMVKVTYTVKQ
jgi:hypothetical protein